MPRYKFAYTIKESKVTRPSYHFADGDTLEMAYNKAVLELAHKYGGATVFKNSATEQPDLPDLSKAMYRKEGWD